MHAEKVVRQPGNLFLRDQYVPNDLRHTAASHIVMSGVDLITVKELLGDTSIPMTQPHALLPPVTATKMKKGLRISPEALGFPGGAERDRTVGLLNAIRNTAPIEPEIPRDDGYPDPESGD